ncbi:MAG: carboxypeptidase regulatory-like domain-containing protein [Acidobacteriota bacterium]|nr:carboxypeptidase regulatory-like domain-containing protein [Acidobacteriota bacterium]
MRALAGFILFYFTSALAAAPATGIIHLTVLDQQDQPIPRVAVELKSGEPTVLPGLTDENGTVRFTQLKSGHYELSVTREGFKPIQAYGVDVPEGTASIQLRLIPAVHQESVEVRGTATPVQQGSSPGTQVPAEIVKELPNHPATVSDALPLVPGVARSPGGGLQLSGSGEHRSALIVNSADVTDPATGQFGLTVPIDSVETLNVYQTPFLAEFGRFTGGLVSVETRRGGDKWKWELNDPFPEFRIRSWDLRGLRTATPRLNIEGPVIPGKLYFSEGFEYAIRKTEVFTLPFPLNQKKQEGVNSFAQLDWVASQRQLLTATIHIAPQRLDFVNLNYFNPETTTPDASTHNYTATIADRLTIGGGLLDNTLSATQFDARVWGQGSQDLIVRPGGNSGNYFAQQERSASRMGWSATYSLAPISRMGTHNIKVGSYVAASSDRGQIHDHPIEIFDSGNQLLETIAFTGGTPFRQVDTEYAFFGQDQWIVTPRLALDLGLRAESQEVSEAMRLAPRAGVAWSPFANSGTTVRAGVGLFYDRVPLNVYSFDHYPSQIVTTFNPSGQILAGPFLYENGLGEVSNRPPFVFQRTTAGNFSPRSDTWNIQMEQRLTDALTLRAGYLRKDSAGLVILDHLAADPATGIGTNLLSGAGQSRYRQFEVTAKVRLKANGHLFLSYVRSSARGDLNDFATFLGSFPGPIIRGNQFSNLPTDLPNRFLAWGVIQLPWKFRIAPSVEYRSGFPYAVTDASQNYVGVPDQNRFPTFFSADARVSKDFKVNPKYTVRLSVSSFNLTDHFNPEAFHSNTSDPAYGLFFGQRGRHFTADFDVIF